MGHLENLRELQLDVLAKVDFSVPEQAWGALRLAEASFDEEIYRNVIALIELETLPQFRTWDLRAALYIAQLINHTKDEAFKASISNSLHLRLFPLHEQYQTPEDLVALSKVVFPIQPLRRDFGLLIDELIEKEHSPSPDLVGALSEVSKSFPNETLADWLDSNSFAGSDIVSESVSTGPQVLAEFSVPRVSAPRDGRFNSYYQLSVVCFANRDSPRVVKKDIAAHALPELETSQHVEHLLDAALFLDLPSFDERVRESILDFLDENQIEMPMPTKFSVLGRNFMMDVAIKLRVGILGLPVAESLDEVRRLTNQFWQQQEDELTVMAVERFFAELDDRVPNPAFTRGDRTSPVQTRLLQALAEVTDPDPAETPLVALEMGIALGAKPDLFLERARLLKELQMVARSELTERLVELVRQDIGARRRIFSLERAGNVPERTRILVEEMTMLDAARRSPKLGRF